MKFSKYVEELIADDMESTEEGEKYTRADAVKYIYNRAEDEGDKEVLKNMRPILIDAGVFVHKTDEQLARTQIFGGRVKKYDFIISGKKYAFESWKPLTMTRAAPEDIARMWKRLWGDEPTPAARLDWKRIDGELLDLTQEA